MQPYDQGSPSAPADKQMAGQAHLTRYLQNFTSISSQLLQSGMDSTATDAVEATWVLSLALKGLYNTLKVTTLSPQYLRSDLGRIHNCFVIKYRSFTKLVCCIGTVKMLSKKLTPPPYPLG